MAADSGGGLERFLFDLASESRLGILQALSKKNLKMNEVAKTMDLTATENFRQLQRLTEAQLIQKQPDSTYTLTQVGKLTLQLLPALEVINKHKVYFNNHDIWRLPGSFINRLGEVSEATLSLDTVENFNHAAHVVAEAEKFVWGIGDKALESVGSAMMQVATKGVKFRFIFHESLLPKYGPVRGEEKFMEKRTLTEIPGMIFCSDKEGAICLPMAEGRMDYAGFFSKDQVFLNWTRDLFLHYWDRAKHTFPQ